MSISAVEVQYMITLVKATNEHIEKLTALSKAAFDTDISVGAEQAGGPPEYDSEKWHHEMQKSGNLFSLFCDENLIGGAVLFTDRNSPAVLYVGRIFIDPLHHRQGYGMELMKQIELAFPEVKIFRLETPFWNRRTYAFYTKCGFIEKYRDAESVYFEKDLAGR